MKPAIVVSGLGLVTAYGVGTQAFWDGMVTGTDPSPATARAVDGTRRIGTIAGGARDWLALAIDEAMAEASFGSTDEQPLLVVAAQSVAPDAVAAENPIYAPSPVASSCHSWAEPLVVSHACASVLFAVDLAHRILTSATASSVLVVAVTEVTACMVDSLQAVRAIGSSPSRPFDVRRDGITIGEGAGAVLLETAAAAAARGLSSRVRLAATAASVDGRSAAASDHSAVLGCLLKAVDAAGVSAVDYVHAHATGTPQGDAAEAVAIAGLVQQLGGPEVAVSSHKGALGHLLHASALPGLVAGVRAIQTGVVPGTVNLDEPLQQPGASLPAGGQSVRPAAGVRTALVNAFGFGGNNATALLQG
jgi:3-oxoacyl-[acyl-carrier-protein] synthase II